MYKCFNSINLEIICLTADAIEMIYKYQFSAELGTSGEITAYLAMAVNCLNQAVNIMRNDGVKPLQTYTTPFEALALLKSIASIKTGEE